jgi:hypothetical protein
MKNPFLCRQLDNSITAKERREERKRQKEKKVNVSMRNGLNNTIRFVSS